MNDLLAVAQLFQFGLVVVAVLTMPRWLGRRLSRYALWRYRDRVALEIIEGKAIPNCPESRRLLNEIESSISVSRSFTLLRVVLVGIFSTRFMTAEAMQQMAARHAPDLSGLPPENRRKLEQRYSHLRWLETRMLVQGSWLGLSLLGLASVIAAFRAIGREINLRTATRETLIHEVNDTFVSVFVASGRRESLVPLVA